MKNLPINFSRDGSSLLKMESVTRLQKIVFSFFYPRKKKFEPYWTDAQNIPGYKYGLPQGIVPPKIYSL